jgi:hypothetical protein
MATTVTGGALQGFMIWFQHVYPVGDRNSMFAIRERRQGQIPVTAGKFSDERSTESITIISTGSLCASGSSRLQRFWFSEALLEVETIHRLAQGSRASSKPAYRLRHNLLYRRFRTAFITGKFPATQHPSAPAKNFSTVARPNVCFR